MLETQRKLDHKNFTPEKPPVIVINAIWGNEPLILGGHIGISLSKRLEAAGFPKPVVLTPLVYPGRQQQIMHEEYGQNIDRLVVDDQMGNFLQRIMFAQGQYSSHINNLIEQKGHVEDLLEQRFSPDSLPIQVKTVSGLDVEIDPKQIITSIDIGSRVSLPADSRYYCFPYLLSELMEETISEADKGNEQIIFDTQAMLEIRDLAKINENGYRKMFIPQISTLSCRPQYPYKFGEVSHRQTLLTPPLKPNIDPQEGLVLYQGVYLMFSGTNTGYDENEIIIGTANKSGYGIYVPPWVGENYSQFSGVRLNKESPSVMADVKILALCGRAGWGTGWLAQVLKKPWIVPEYQTNDDPEIYFNTETIRQLGIGAVLNFRQFSILDQVLRTSVDTCSITLENHWQRHFNPQFKGEDGIQFVARKIEEDLFAA